MIARARAEVEGMDVTPKLRPGDRVRVADERGIWHGTYELDCCSEHAYVRADPKPKDGELRRANRRQMERERDG